MSIGNQSEYRYDDASPTYPHAYLDSPVLGIVKKEAEARPLRRAFELGCGNGSFAALLARSVPEIVAVDVSESGIAMARSSFDQVHFDVASAYDDLAETYGQFDAVISLEVVEHLYSPRRWASNLSALLEPGGIAIVSTPYHGYWKNLALAITGKLENHLNPLWDHGHIKFWTPQSLRLLLQEAGLEVERILRVGRIPVLAKSMIMTARKP